MAEPVQFRRRITVMEVRLNKYAINDTTGMAAVMLTDGENASLHFGYVPTQFFTPGKKYDLLLTEVVEKTDEQ